MKLNELLEQGFFINENNDTVIKFFPLPLILSAEEDAALAKEFADLLAMTSIGLVDPTPSQKLLLYLLTQKAY